MKTRVPASKTTTRLVFGLLVGGLSACSAEPGTGSDVPGTGGSVPSTGGTTSTGGVTSSGGVTGGGGVSSGGTSAGGVTTSTGGSTGGMATGGSDSADGGTSAGGADTGSGGEAATGGSDAGSGGSDGGFVLPTEANSIAYTGCSMAYNIGTGYGRVGGNVMWNSDSYQTGAMVVQNWTDPGSASWNLFDQKMNSIGGKDNVKAIMLQICIFSSRATDDELHAMVNAAREHINPGTHIFMVGQPQYNAGHSCTLAGEGGAEWTDMKAQELANDPSINENMSYLGQFILDAGAGEVMSDTCHATSSGEDEMGRQAIEFFGG